MSQNKEAIPPEGRRLVYLNLAVSEKGLAELSGDKIMVFVPRDNIHTVELKYGLRAERPLLQGVLAALLLGLGAGGIIITATSGLVALRWVQALVFCGVVGAWLLWEVAKRGHYLLVVCSNNTRKLVIEGKIVRAELSEFLQSATKLGFVIRNSLEDTLAASRAENAGQ